MSSLYDDRQRQFNEYLRDGISAAKNGQCKLAQTLLNRALYLNSADARPYLWLSSTTDDSAEQIEYLEQAVARDPTNAAARRGLALLKGKIDSSRLVPQGEGVAAVQQAQSVDAQGRSFQCPRCGGRMTFEVQSSLLTCEYCGYQETGEQEGNGGQQKPWNPEHAEQVLDFVMPTTVGHQWATAQQQLKCERCGALSVLPPGQRAHTCPYCGANQFIETAQAEEMVEPQCIVLMKIDEHQATQIAQRWLGKGVFAPDSLVGAASSLRLRPAYYSCWTFDGMVEMRWTCEVAEGSGNNKHWRTSNGVEMQFFNDVLVPGVKALSTKALESLSPFNLFEAQEFKPEYLAGWPALIYDRSLSDASLVGREIVMRRLRPQMVDLIEIGREKRNLNISSGAWSGLTFKHILLPLWSGVYRFQGKEYQLLINGQTGKIFGDKPRDNFKLVFAILIGVMILALLVVLYWLLNSPGVP